MTEIMLLPYYSFEAPPNSTNDNDCRHEYFLRTLVSRLLLFRKNPRTEENKEKRRKARKKPRTEKNKENKRKRKKEENIKNNKDNVVRTS